MRLYPSDRASCGRAAVALAVALAAPGCRPGPTDRVQGYVEGDFVYVASPLAGQVETLAVQRGARVKKGEPLFALESASERASRDEASRRLVQARANLDDARRGKRPSEIASIEAQAAQARAALALSSADLARQERLMNEGAISADSLDRARSLRDQDLHRAAQIEADLKTAQLGSRSDQIAAAEAEVSAREASLAKADWDLAQKRQSAPMDAQVFDTLYREGEWVASGKPVVSLLPPGNVKVRAYVSEKRIGAVHAGDTVTVVADGAPHPFAGRIAFVSPQAEYTPPVIYSRENRSKLVFLIEARFDEGTAAQLHPGQPVDVQLAP